MSTWRAAAGLVVWVAVSFLPSLAAVGIQPGEWYNQLNRPSWTPPNWVFGPVWTALYLMMGIAAWIIWLQPAGAPRRQALAAFFVQLVFNAAWTPLFFGLKMPGLALVDIVLMWLAIAITIILFWRIRPAAGMLLVPYLAWVSYATTLNAGFWYLN